MCSLPTGVFSPNPNKIYFLFFHAVVYFIINYLCKLNYGILNTLIFVLIFMDLLCVKDSFVLNMY